MAVPPAGPRARYREQVTAEVRGLAWSQVESAGVSALSLKAIAHQLGMTAPALYRYVGSRDELLTELVLSAYRDLAETVEAAASGEPAARVRGIADAIRAWALASPQRYLLLYGTPVPGYQAPAEATELAQRIFAPLHTALEVLTAGSRTPAGRAGFDRTVRLWTRVHGVLGLELAGHFTTMDVEPERLFADEVTSVLDD
jgi:AcrR family transcriptional regulator